MTRPMRGRGIFPVGGPPHPTSRTALSPTNRSTAARALLSLVGAGAAIAACSSNPERSSTDSVLSDAPIAWSLDAPRRWDERVQIEDQPSPMNGRARSTRIFNYQPHDSTVRPQALLLIAVYDSATWREVVAEGGPPLGDTLATSGGHVFIAGLPQSNPFAALTRDALAFDSLAVTVEEARRAFRILK